LKEGGVVLQEEQTVPFQPEYIWVQQPLYIGLFRLYLLLVALWAVLRFTRFLWSFRRSWIAQLQNKSATEYFQFLEYSSVKANSFKTVSQLTFLISAAVLAWTSSDGLAQVAMQKTSGFRAVAGWFADALQAFSVGVTVSAALFCFATICNSVVRRQRQTPANTA
jgi:hypothetical protein